MQTAVNDSNIDDNFACVFKALVFGIRNGDPGVGCIALIWENKLDRITGLGRGGGQTLFCDRGRRFSTEETKAKVFFTKNDRTRT